MCKRIYKGKELKRGLVVANTEVTKRTFNQTDQFRGYSIKLIRAFSCLSHRKDLDRHVVKAVPKHHLTDR